MKNKNVTNAQLASELTTLANQLYSANNFQAAELCRIAGLRLVDKPDLSCDNDDDGL